MGVKQGCVMSPTLFNFFINDILETLDHLDCDPVLLNNLKIYYLLFADDIVLLYETVEGLQNSLDRLHDYCNKWLLTINTQKTQIPVMNKQGRCPNLHFTFNNEPLQVVKHYKYLGLLITSSGSFIKSVENLLQRAMKAMFKIRNIIYQSDIKTKSMLHLFDTLVRPIAPYGCEVWGAYTTKAGLFLNDAKLDGFDSMTFYKLD